MTERSRFRSSVWFVPVAFLVGLAFVVHGAVHAGSSGETLPVLALRALATAIPLLPATALAQQVILAQGRYSSVFSFVIAAFIVTAIGTGELLVLIVAGTFLAIPGIA
jgi:hypothetical protein